MERKEVQEWASKTGLHGAVLVRSGTPDAKLLSNPNNIQFSIEDVRVSLKE